MKKLVAFLLVMVLTLTSMASCFAAEPVTLRVMIAIRDMDTLTDPSEMPALQALEEKTGVKIEWEVVKASDFPTKINLAFLIPEEYPDIILTVQNSFDVWLVKPMIPVRLCMPPTARSIPSPRRFPRIITPISTSS